MSLKLENEAGVELLRLLQVFIESRNYFAVGEFLLTNINCALMLTFNLDLH